MSHIVTIETKVRDAAAVEAACRRLHLPRPTHRTVDYYDGERTGLAVELPSWKYAIVYELASGKMHSDTWGARRGAQQELDRFLQAYAAEKTKIEARRKGHTVTEQTLSEGSIKLTVQVAGGAA